MKKIASVISSLLFLHIVSSTLSAQLQTIYDKDLRSRTEEGKKSYKVPNSGYDMYSSVVYIDPSKSVNGSGTIDDPLNTWPSDLKAKTAYLQKRGTIYENDIEEQSGNYILVGAYGSGPRPRFTGDVILTGEGAVVREINISDGLLKIGKWPYTDVENCWVYDCEIKAITVFTSETKIIGNVIHNSGTDGIWTSGSTFGNYNRNIEIAYNHIYNVNMRWYPGATEKEAPGDGIQAEASGFIHIHHNIIDRSSTGSKFCIIVGHQDAAPLDALIEDNVMYSPLKTENGGAFIYLKDNVNAVIRNNKFIDMENDGLISIFAYIPSEIYGNLMVGVRRDFPPKSKAYNNTCVNVAKPNAHVELLENNILTRETSGTKGNNMYIDKAGLKNLFVDPDNGDFRLKEGSPAIGAGKKVGNWTKDMHGVKVKDQNVDMGAFVYTKNIEDNDDPTPSNLPPVAHAGNDQVVISGSKVVLDASGSYDPESKLLQFKWIAEDSRIVLSDPDQAVTSFEAPVVSGLTKFSISLQVTDPENASSSDAVTVQVKPAISLIEGEKLNIHRVIASDHDGNLPENTIDGNLSTRWSAEGNNHWIRYDLNADSLYFIKTAWYKGDQRKNYFDLEISEDEINWIPVLSGAETSGKTESFQTFTFNGMKANYLRIKVFGNSINDWNSLLEFEAYGVPSQVNKTKPEIREEDITLYPNPASDIINIDLTKAPHPQILIQILNIKGQIVDYRNVTKEASIVDMDVSSLKTGHYFLQLSGPDNHFFVTKRFIKK